MILLNYIKKSLIYRLGFYLLCIITLMSVCTYYLLYSYEVLSKFYMYNKEYDRVIYLSKKELKKSGNSNLYAVELLAKSYLFSYLDKISNLGNENVDDNLSNLLISSTKLFKIIIDNKDKYNYKVSSDVYFLLCFSCFLSGEYLESLNYIHKASLHNKNDKLLKRLFYDFKDLRVNKYTEYTEISYFCIDALIGTLYFYNGDYDNAIKFYQKSIQLASDFYNSKFINNKMNVRDYYNSISIYKVYLGLSYISSKKYFKGINILNNACDKLDKDILKVRIFKLISNNFENMGLYIDAVKYLNKVAVIKPSSDLYYKIGYLYSKVGLFKQAKEYWIKSLRLDSDNNLSRLSLIRFKYLS